MVFQQGALFEWMSVDENVGFGPRMAGRPAAETAARVEELLGRVGLRGFGETPVYQLSGGMQQRVALARCLANDPEVILMDEPLGALDALTREKMQGLVLRLWKESGTTIVLITHSVEEALFLGERLIVMAPRPGRIVRELRLPFAARGADRRAAHDQGLGRVRGGARGDPLDDLGDGGRDHGRGGLSMAKEAVQLAVWLGLADDPFTRQKTVRFGDASAVDSGRVWSLAHGGRPLRALGAVLGLRLDRARLLAADRGTWDRLVRLATEGFRNVPLWEHVGISVFRVLTGVALGALVGIPLGFAMGLSSVARGLFDPIVEFMRPIPPLALIPLVILWFGIDETAKIFLLFLAALFIMTIAARAGAAEVRIAKVHAAYSLGASRSQVLRHVILPNALPEIFTGLRTAMGVCWGTVVAAELVAADRGLGSMIMIAKNFLQTDTVVIGIVIIGLIGYAIELRCAGPSGGWCRGAGRGDFPGDRPTRAGRLSSVWKGWKNRGWKAAGIWLETGLPLFYGRLTRDTLGRDRLTPLRSPPEGPRRAAPPPRPRSPRWRESGGRPPRRGRSGGSRRPRAALLRRDHRLAEEPVHLLHEVPGVLVGHAHGAGAGGDRALGRDPLEELDLARADPAGGVEVDPEAEGRHGRAPG